MIQPVAGAWPERPLTPLLPPKRARSRGWGEEWICGEKGILREDSGISVSTLGRTSTGYMMSEASSSGEGSARNTSPDQESLTRSTLSGRQRAHTVTPTSSITSFSTPSVLSIMGMGDLPELVQRPSLRYSSLSIQVAPPHEWRSSRTASLSELVPFADIHELRRRSSCCSSTVRQGESWKELSPIPKSPPARQTSLRRRSLRRASASRTIPRSYISYEKELDEHLRKIEISVARSRSQMTKRDSQKTMSMVVPRMIPDLAQRDSQSQAGLPVPRDFARRNTYTHTETVPRRISHTFSSVPPPNPPTSLPPNPPLVSRFYAPTPLHPAAPLQMQLVTRSNTLYTKQPVAGPLMAAGRLRPASWCLEVAAEEEEEGDVPVQGQRRLSLGDLAGSSWDLDPRRTWARRRSTTVQLIGNARHGLDDRICNT
jgi:hypothetical protein